MVLDLIYDEFGNDNEVFIDELEGNKCTRHVYGGLYRLLH